MWLYLILLLIPIITYVFFNEQLGHSVAFLGSYMLILALFVGLGDMLGGYDRYVYGQIFDNIADNMAAGYNLLDSDAFTVYSKELGFDFYNVIVAFFTSNRYIFILVTTLLIYLLLFFSFKQYLDNYPLGLFIFMTLWFFFTFTYLRQVIAASIGFLSIKYLIEKKPYKFFLIVIIAATFHNSALILALLYFMPTRAKYKPSNVVVFMILCLILGITGLPSSVFNVYEDVTADYLRISQYKELENNFRIAYVLEIAFFLFLILGNYNLFKLSNRKDMVLLNMMLCFCAVLLLFVKSSNGGRMSWYFMLGVLATISKVIQRSDQRKFYLCLVIPLFMVLYLRIYNAWQVTSNLYPYKTFLTNGHRQNDVVWSDCEYDLNYDKDKFYR